MGWGGSKRNRRIASNNEAQAQRTARASRSTGAPDNANQWVFMVISNEGREQSFVSARDAKNYLNKTLKNKGRIERRRA